MKKHILVPLMLILSACENLPRDPPLFHYRLEILGSDPAWLEIRDSRGSRGIQSANESRIEFESLEAFASAMRLSGSDRLEMNFYRADRLVYSIDLPRESNQIVRTPEY